MRAAGPARRRPVWTSAPVEALALFGVEEKSARRPPARTAAEGRPASERVGGVREL